MPKETNKKQENKNAVSKKQDVKKDSKKDAKNKKHFMKDFRAELKRVIWPTPKQLFNNTVAVITVVLITAAIVFVLDLAFESLNTYGINKLKEAVESNSSEATNIVDSNTVNEIDSETADEEDNTNQTGTENSVSDDANSVE